MVSIRWVEEMKITKARLLQIIREEVELREKYVEENVLELDEETLEELSKEEGKEAINKEVAADKQAGNLHSTREDRLLDPKTKKPVDGTKAK
jgi:hypothetical protein